MRQASWPKKLACLVKKESESEEEGEEEEAEKGDFGNSFGRWNF